MNRLKLSGLSLLVCLGPMTSCVKPKTSSVAAAADSGASATVCVGLQGNGLRFASHVGT